MTLYKGNSKIKDRGSFGVYAGSTPIKQIYKGSDLVYQFESYDPNTTVVDVTNGNSSTVTLKKGVYSLFITGGGGTGGTYYGAGGTFFTASGGSGATWEGTFKLDADTTVVAFGCGIDADSYINVNGDRMITAGGGRKTSYGNPETDGGTLTVESDWSSYVVTTDKAVSGNDGQTGAVSIPNGGDTTSTYKWGEGTTLHTTGAVQYGGVKIIYIRYE